MKNCFFKILVQNFKKKPQDGFEPSAFRLQSERSNQLSYKGVFYIDERFRSSDLLVMSQARFHCATSIWVLYRPSTRSRVRTCACNSIVELKPTPLDRSGIRAIIVFILLNLNFRKNQFYRKNLFSLNLFVKNDSMSFILTVYGTSINTIPIFLQISFFILSLYC